MKLNLIKTFLLLFILTSYSANACECIIIKSIEKEFKSADYVLSGKVVQIDYVQILQEKDGKSRVFTSKSRDKFDIFKGRVLAKITFDSIEVFKGNKRKKEVIIYTGSSGGGDCGYYFELNEQYLIYAFKDSWGTKELRDNKRKHKQTLYTDRCTRTKVVDSEEIEKIRLLKE
ncbi:hypothetical protein [Lutibacter maritimus]|uniref:Tissue inhibitor of metalloproteinase n=1 Tax=Lutibacter maritimus TaxID=593133 RepID=A0A1I6SXR7_9FLAO|nr:hypothetical protein [Lutibacter maritimus]SFS81761.1 Tissue inhibitor of metalloproteinase [Lutibacter maritimus]